MLPRHVVVAVATCVLVSACASASNADPAQPSPTPSASPSPSPSTPRPTEDANAEAETWRRLIPASRTFSAGAPEVRNRAGRVSCGEFVLVAGPRVGQFVPAAARTCFEEKIGQGDAVLAVVQPNAQGKPLVIFNLTTSEPDGYDVAINNRWATAGGDWSLLRCTGKRFVDTPAQSCRPR